MRRQIKNEQSKVIAQNLKYISTNTRNNRRIYDLILSEQKFFCAYTEEYISRTDAADIEHFDPTLKNTEFDGYHNWYVVKHRFNIEKGTKWNSFQPILNPTSDDFEQRIIYVDGNYIVADSSDIKAVNLLRLLQLDDVYLAENRKKYIARKKDEMKAMGEEPLEFFKTLFEQDPARINYIRAISEEFEIDLWNVLQYY